MNTNVHIVSHIKEKIVNIETKTEAEEQRLADIDEDIAKVSNVHQHNYRHHVHSAVLIC